VNLRRRTTIVESAGVEQDFDQAVNGIVPGDRVTVHVGTDAYTGIVWRNRGYDLDLDITEDGRTHSGWSWNLISRVDIHRFGNVTEITR
jgi:hypothetical protein